MVLDGCHNGLVKEILPDDLKTTYLRGDTVTLPSPNAFHSIEAYFSTRYHELGHATGSAKRLNRQFGKRFGDDAYAFEEIVALSGQSAPCLSLH